MQKKFGLGRINLFAIATIRSFTMLAWEYMYSGDNGQENYVHISANDANEFTQIPEPPSSGCTK